MEQWRCCFSSIPGLTPDQVKARLMKTASKNFPPTSIAVDPVSGAMYTSQYDIFTIGAGYLDILAAPEQLRCGGGQGDLPHRRL